MSVTVNVEVIIAAILGGMGTIVGAGVGGILLILLREQLSKVAWTVPIIDTPVSDIDFLVFALITLVLLYALPGGIVRWVIELGGQGVAKLRGDEEVAADGGRTPLEQVYDSYAEWFSGGDDDER